MTEVFAVHGGAQLNGSVEVHGAKNSVLKLMAAALLAPGRTVLHNCPQILDTEYMAKVLEGVGARVTVHDDIIEIETPEELNPEAIFPVMRQFRASLCILGPLIARCRKAVIALPGGDAIGTRPLDIHRAGLAAMGVKTSIEHGNLYAQAHNLQGVNFQLPWPSVGATENIMMAAVLSPGITVIDNSAREPEIVDLCTMLASMGVELDGIGTSTITVRGAQKLEPTTHHVVGDRLVAATWAAAAVITQGDITINGIKPNHMQVVLDKFRLAGAEITLSERGITVVQNGRPKAFNVSTLPYPGFPTDLQAMAVVIGAIADGVSIITENVFDARFRFVEEMVRLGADARIEGHHAVLRGISRLSSAPVWGTDVRAGAGLVLAGLCAEGTTYVHDIHHIDRGYPLFLENLCDLGAYIERIEIDNEFLL